MADVEEQDPNELISFPDQEDPKFRWTTKKRRFVQLMARLGEVDTARERAGFTTAGYGSVLMAQMPIRSAVMKEVRVLLNAQMESEESVLDRWHLWANSNAKDYFDANWELKDISTLTDEQARCIKKVIIRQTAHGRDVNLELYDASRANENLANFMGMLKTDGELVAPEETAKTIKQMLEAMRETNATEPPMEAGTPAINDLN